MTDSMIVEAIRSLKMNDVDQTAVAGQVPGVQQVADPDAVERFQAAMGPAKVQDIPFADKLSASWVSAQDNYQGLVHRIKALAELRGEHALSAGEMAELQYSVATLSFQQEVVAKVADKASNAVQTLIKNQ